MSSKDRRRQVELHTHSTASDGRYAPERLAELCRDHDVELWSLTDHDTCRGCRAARRAAERLGVEFLPGIEISAYLRRSIHVLGYGVDPGAAVLAELTDQLRQRRLERMGEMVERLSELGVDIELSAVRAQAGKAPLSRAHLARVLVEGGFVDDADTAFDRWIGAEGPAYVPVGWPSVPETIGIIHEAGGAAVLAHPGRYEADDRIGEWSEAGLDGIEVRHPSHSDDDERRYRRLAESHQLLMTASSDYHGFEGKDDVDFGQTRLPVSRIESLQATIEQYS